MKHEIAILEKDIPHIIEDLNLIEKELAYQTKYGVFRNRSFYICRDSKVDTNYFEHYIRPYYTMFIPENVLFKDGTKKWDDFPFVYSGDIRFDYLLTGQEYNIEKLTHTRHVINQLNILYVHEDLD